MLSDGQLDQVGGGFYEIGRGNFGWRCNRNYIFSEQEANLLNEKLGLEKDKALKSGNQTLKELNNRGISGSGMCGLREELKKLGLHYDGSL